jgi:hypothetical protein
MAPAFKSTLWQILVPPPWKAEDCEHCIEFTQPEGVGALHISASRKEVGEVLNAESLSALKDNCPENIVPKNASCGEFEGYWAEYIDATSGFYWKRWIVACRKVLLFITYTCPNGEEELEAPQASALLSSLQCRE